MFLTIVIFIVVLSVLVIFHELGHFLMARRYHIKVLEFGLGLPPRAIKLFQDKRGTLYSVNWLPFGGFVAMAGEDENPPEDSIAMDIDPAPPAKNAPDTDFYLHTRKERLMAILAGPFFSFIFGLLCFVLLYAAKGVPANYEGVRITSVAAESPAAMAGLPEQVDIVSAQAQDGTTLGGDALTVNSFITFTAEHRGQTLTLTTTGACDPQGNDCDETAHTYELYVRTQEETPVGQGSLGLSFQLTYSQRLAWWQVVPYAIFYGLKESLMLVVMILQGLSAVFAALFTGQNIGAGVAGPVGIVTVVNETGLFNQGFWAVVSFAGMLSINLAIMNILPIPAVDGGRALLISLEKVFSRRRIAKIEGTINTVGFIALIALMVLITARDIWYLIK